MSLSFSATTSRGGFDLEIAFQSSARVIAVQGPSGAGKTTLLLALAGLIPAQAATLVVNGETLVDTKNGIVPLSYRRRIGFVFQDIRLFPHMTVRSNIAFGRRFAASPMPIDRALDLLDLGDLVDRWPASLSGGEMRRVALARALCVDPAVLFLDEPFAGLDAGRRDALTPYLLRLRDETQVPMLLVSHDPRDIEALAQDSVSIIDGRGVARTGEAGVSML